MLAKQNGELIVVSYLLKKLWIVTQTETWVNPRVSSFQQERC